jgi:ABC-type oligopeptide transport system ATPase subunit
MQSQLGLTILFVAHDLAVIQQVCTNVAVLAEGKIVEQGPTSTVLRTPHHPYTRSLLDAVPVPDPVVARERTRQRRNNDAENADAQADSAASMPVAVRHHTIDN